MDNSSALGRLYAALGARTQIEAAEQLGVRQSALSDCKRRGNIVTGNVLEKAVMLSISVEWIQEGKLPMWNAALSTTKCNAGRYCLEACPALEYLQQAVRLISRCPYICKACEHNQP